MNSPVHVLRMHNILGGLHCILIALNVRQLYINTCAYVLCIFLDLEKVVDIFGSAQEFYEVFIVGDDQQLEILLLGSGLDNSS